MNEGVANGKKGRVMKEGVIGESYDWRTREELRWVPRGEWREKNLP